jgi:hypothetical protein
MANDDITIHLGDAFLLDIPNTEKKHLYIAISKTGNNKYLFVNVTTRRAKSETACILKPGVGVPKFIKNESVIIYQYAREMDAIELAGFITKNSPIPKDSCSADILYFIQQGGLVSKRLPIKFKKALKQFLESEKD